MVLKKDPYVDVLNKTLDDISRNARDDEVRTSSGINISEQQPGKEPSLHNSLSLSLSLSLSVGLLGFIDYVEGQRGKLRTVAGYPMRHQIWLAAERKETPVITGVHA
jgi:hypothetical protein